MTNEQMARRHAKLKRIGAGHYEYEGKTIYRRNINDPREVVPGLSFPTLTKAVEHLDKKG